MRREELHRRKSWRRCCTEQLYKVLLTQHRWHLTSAEDIRSIFIRAVTTRGRNSIDAHVTIKRAYKTFGAIYSWDLIPETLRTLGEIRIKLRASNTRSQVRNLSGFPLKLLIVSPRIFLGIHFIWKFNRVCVCQWSSIIEVCKLYYKTHTLVYREIDITSRTDNFVGFKSEKIMGSN